jgi:hypothetical protein
LENLQQARKPFAPLRASLRTCAPTTKPALFLTTKPAEMRAFYSGANTPLPVEHKVRLQRVEQWAQTGTVKSPVEMLRRERVRELLGLKNEAVR